MDESTAIQRMKYNMTGAREMAAAGLLSDYMRGHFSARISTYAIECYTPRAIEFNRGLQAELELLENVKAAA